jgi:hypothetical protein
MAQKVITEFIDDIDGSVAERTFTFAVDGTNYEIDLSVDNIKEFTEAVAGFVESARRVKASGNGHRARSVGSKPGSNREHLAAVRAWLRQQGHSVQDRGRIAAELMAKFDAAHASPAVSAPAAYESSRGWA